MWNRSACAVTVAIITLAGCHPLAAAPLTDREFRSTLKDLQRDIATLHVDGIRTALLKLAEDRSPRALEAILKVGVSVEDLRVYDAVREVLPKLDCPDVRRFIAGELGRMRDHRGQVLILDLLRTLDPERIDPDLQASVLERAVKDRREDVRLAALHLLAHWQSKDAVGPLIDLLARYEKARIYGTVWIEIQKTLSEITGKEFDRSALWREWWDVAKEHFDPKAVPRGRTGVVKVNRREPRVPEFFGVEVASKRIMFILDVSSSTAKVDAGEKTSRLEREKKELCRVIRELRPDTKLGIIAFSDKTQEWKPGKIVPASGQNKADAIRFVSAWRAEGFTFIRQALELAFKNPEINTIFLLSDGHPTSASGIAMPDEPITEAVRLWNRFRRVRIHTLGFPEARRSFMNRLASENGGTYRLITSE